MNENINTGAKDQKNKAVWSLALGIFGLVAWLLPILGLPVQIVGLVFGIKSINSSKGKLAAVGIALCIIGLVLTIINASIGAYMGATSTSSLLDVFR